MARPRQPILSRDLIVTTALDLIDRTGRFTIPELAHRLQVSVSSLYHHVAGRADIVEGIRGRLVALMTMPTEPDWQDAVVHWATSYRDAFAAHPAAIPLLVGQTVSDPATLAQYDQLAEVLHERAGLTGDDLVVAITMLDTLCLGAALDLGAPSEVWAVDRDSMLTRSLGGTPHAELSRTAFDRQLRLIVADLARHPRGDLASGAGSTDDRAPAPRGRSRASRLTGEHTVA
ncbi:MAG TPA: TetR/AcrR family transcriptional regulator C-terminal domain-containing protein [Microlunatus sp.]|nr:TetR/AcrR family transcriptional regulator C-terminal domain-containing protein [Microlunatus sp.]